MNSPAQPRLIAHIIFRFDYGGLENGVVNVIRGTSSESTRHVVIALTETTAFADRLGDVAEVYALEKQPGKDPRAYLRLYRLLRTLKPAIVHTRNIGTLDCTLVAWLARVPIRIHGEHGWDVADPDGTSRKYRLMRQLLSRFVDRFTTVSADLRDWLINTVGVSSAKVTHICNGVDTARFRPAENAVQSPLPAGWNGNNVIVVGAVTRFSTIKDPMNLVEAFVELCAGQNTTANDLRLVMIGDGELHQRAQARLEEAGLADRVWLPGSRDDIAELLRAMHVFVLGSYREGISNTILEAMASGLPVIATDTGGNRELVENGVSGTLVPPADSSALAQSIASYATGTETREQHGAAARNRAVTRFSIAEMVRRYGDLYENLLEAKAA